MKNNFSAILAILLAAFVLQACQGEPVPYEGYDGKSVGMGGGDY